MANVFDQFDGAPAATNPFDQFDAPAPQAAPATPVNPHRSALDQLLGIGGPRYQTFPERAIRGIASGIEDLVTLPGQVMKEAEQPKTTISDSDVSALSVPRALNFAAIASPLSPGLRAGEAVIPGQASSFVPQKVPIPTTEQLAQAGAADIKGAQNSGLEVKAPTVGEWSRGVQQQLLSDGIHPVDAPATFAKLQELENAPPGAYATAANLISLRRSLGKTAQNFNPAAGADQLAASRAINGLDQFLPNIDPQGVLAGTPSATADLLKRGNANYAAAMRSNDLTGTLDRANTGILERAQARAQAANSGRNLDNTIRQKVASLLERPKEVSGYSDPEIAALNGVLQGGKARNTARYIGNLLGGGGGVGQSAIAGLGAAGGAGAGAVIGGPVGAVIGATALPATGAVAKTIANVLARRSLNKADELVRSNSPLYREMLSQAPLVPEKLAQRAAVAKAVLLAAMNSQNQ